MSRRQFHRRPLIPPPKPVRRPLEDALALLLAAEDLQRAGQLPAALRGYRVIMEGLGKGNAIAHRAMFLTALCAWQMRIYGEAILLMEEVRRLQPTNPDAHYNLGLFYHAVGRPVDAADSYRFCLALKPEYAAAENNLGNALRELGDVETASLCFDRLIARDPQDPEARYNLAHVVLLRGQLARGFDLYESRWQCAGWNAEYGRPDIGSPRLEPGAPAGTHVLVHQEQGLGDTLMFLRYLPRLAALGYRLTFEAPRELGRWLKSLESDQLTVIQRGDAIPAHDAHLPLLSVPPFLGAVEEATLPPPAVIPVRRPSPLAAAPDDPRPLVGFAWAGNPRHHNDRHRSMALADLAPLFTLPGVRFVSLQVGARGVDLLHEIPTLPLGAGSEIVDVSAQLTDFEDTAALVQRCAAVVTVDTSITHLAATLGVRTLLLSSWLSEWRWQLERSDSPWYPTLEILRQPSLGDWAAVVHEAHRRLTSIAAPGVS